MSNIVTADFNIAIADVFSGVESNIHARDTFQKFNTLSVRGKVFRTVIDGTETSLRDDEDNPVNIIQLVILNHNPHRTRMYYAGKFIEGQKTAPNCYSWDGKYPASDVDTPVSVSCETCSMAQKGSKVTDSGVKTTACTQYRHLAVVEAEDIDGPVMHLRLPPTSLWEKDKNGLYEKGWMCWSDFLQFIAQKNIPVTGAIVTAVRFDPASTQPKLLFKPVRAVSGNEAQVVVQRMSSEEVVEMLHLNEVATIPALPSENKPKRLAAPAHDEEEVIQKPKPKAKPQPVIDDDEGEEVIQKPKPKAKPQPVIDDDEGEEIIESSKDLEETLDDMFDD